MAGFFFLSFTYSIIYFFARGEGLKARGGVGITNKCHFMKFTPALKCRLEFDTAIKKKKSNESLNHAHISSFVSALTAGQVLNTTVRQLNTGPLSNLCKLYPICTLPLTDIISTSEVGGGGRCNLI